MNKQKNVPEYLLRIKKSDVLEKRKSIQKIAWKLQYSIPPISQGMSNIQIAKFNQSLTALSLNAQIHRHRFIPPNIDALEIILDYLLNINGSISSHVKL